MFEEEPATKKGGSAWELVTRRVIINSDTGEVIQGLKIDHFIKRNKFLHERLPGGTSNTTIVLYNKDPAVANQVGSKERFELYVADSGASDHCIRMVRSYTTSRSQRELWG